MSAGSLEERWAAARELGERDPRLGRFAPVDAGTFLMGSEEGHGLPSERPQRRVALSRYEMGVVPVTVAEFSRFVPRGYGDRSLWSEPGWAWREEGKVDRPRFWGEADWARFFAPNHPVVGVSFWEAEAYARFAGARLPTEAEWERAARGDDGRIYPWGNEWIAAHAHHRGGPRHTLPVGIFPEGVSPFGLYDAAGNVWEWTRDWYQPGEIKAARGGAWNAMPLQLRCANRNAWRPGARFSNIGFRLAR